MTGNKDVALALLQAIAAGDLPAMRNLFEVGAPVWHPVFGQGTADDYLAMLGTGGVQVTDAAMTAFNTIESEGTVVIEARSDVGLASGGRYRNTYCFVCEIRNGRIANLREYADTAPAVKAFSEASGQQQP